MKIAKVIVEYSAYEVDRVFDYLVSDEMSVSKGCRVYIYFNNRKIIGYVLDVYETNKTKEELEEEFGFTLRYIDSVIDTESLLDDELTSLAFYMQKEYFAPLISCFQTMLPKNLKPQSVKKVKPLTRDFLIVNDKITPSLTPKQQELYDFVKNEKEVLRSSLDNFSNYMIKKLIDEEVLSVIKKEVYREVLINEDNRYNEEHELTIDQERALKEILSHDNETFLLEGVTGSGKSEVYLRLVRHYLNLNKGVILLVPEIILTSQLASRFKHFFKDKLALLHSALNEGEKYDEYRRIRKGEAKIVIGTRSAIFAPVQNLGLIIIDEEHSTSYKQEKTPCYHTLDIALFRKEYLGLNLVLGSATPSLESKVRAMSGQFRQLNLPSRINELELPDSYIIDVSNEKEIISPFLREEIEKRLERKEQVILLLNRRGYAPYVRCKMCLHVYKCPECNVSLNYHSASDSLKCHYCAREYRLNKNCPICKSEYIEKSGYGTQKIEEVIKEQFKGARILRMDADSTSRKNSHLAIVEKVFNNEVDILVGTQMVAKGLNFPNVTLVGVLNADASLNATDFRANERTFQLLVQVLGRAGRADKKGIAVIQTYKKDNQTLNQAAKHDYDSFVKEEIKFRRNLNYPPFRIITYIELRNKDFTYLNTVSKAAKDYLSKFINDEFSVLGPSLPYLSKIGNDYRLRIMLKYKNKHKTIEIINDLRVYLSKYNKVKIIINVDPYSDI